MLRITFEGSKLDARSAEKLRRVGGVAGIKFPTTDRIVRRVYETALYSLSRRGKLYNPPPRQYWWNLEVQVRALGKLLENGCILHLVGEE